MKKKFTDKKYPEIIYEVVGEFWLDEETYVIVFKEMTDIDGDVYHLEAEYHEDENRVTYTRVYDYENVEASCLVTQSFKCQIEKYILKQVGELRKYSILKREINKIKKYNKWLNSLKIEVIDK